MPLPPRDLGPVHVSLNPALAELHRLYPLSRFAPSVALFRLYKLSFDGVPLATQLDLTSWMTLACLEDQSAEHCIANAVLAWRQGVPKEGINAMFAHSAAPFLVPMLVPMATASLPPVPMATAAAPPPPPPPPPQRLPRPDQGKPPPPPPPSPTCAKLHGSVLRVICALVRAAGGKLDKDLFDKQAPRLQRLSSATACRALREFSSAMRSCEDHKGYGRLLGQVLLKYET